MINDERLLLVKTSKAVEELFRLLAVERSGLPVDWTAQHETVRAELFPLRQTVLDGSPTTRLLPFLINKGSTDV